MPHSTFRHRVGVDKPEPVPCISCKRLLRAGVHIIYTKYYKDIDKLALYCERCARQKPEGWITGAFTPEEFKKAKLEDKEGNE